MAQEQSVVGLVAAGMEHVLDVKVPKEEVLQFVGQTLQLELRNTSMNSFIGELVDKMPHENFQVIFATSMIAPELDDPQYTVGERYTGTNNSLKNV